MTDKKIVDDYYSQNQVSSQAGIDGKDKKQKLTLKWKIKTRKDEMKPTSESWESENITPKEYSVKKVKVKKPVIEFHTSWTSPKWEIDKTIETNISEISSSTGKKEYFTSKWQEQKDNSKKQKEGYTTQYKKTLDNKTAENKTQNSWYIRTSTDWLFDTKKETKVSVLKTKQKPFWDKKIEKKEDEWVAKKAFKKDKSAKYSKNIIIEEDDFTFSRSNKIKQLKKEDKKIEDIQQTLTDRTWETVVIPEILTVKELSEKIWVPLMKLITEFMKNGMKVTINSKIDFDTASIIVENFSIKLQKDISSWFGVEDMLSWNIATLLQEEDKTLLEVRPPVVSIMWHVDHGKTSLLDYLRKTKVVDKEAWWITQSIGAYQVEYNNQKITFLDTPWHEAFTVMRARGAKSTDVAILVVAADEGVKPQTVESINHAREAELQMIVAITKIDKEGANLDNVKAWLSQHGVLSEDWGGDVPMVGVSSKTWAWIDELLELILILAEMSQLTANINRLAVGTVLESHLDTKLWPVSTLLINTGTLKKWDSIVCKWSYGKVKVMKSDLGKNIDSATPSTPVLVVWLDNVCEWGDIVQVVSDIEKARWKALEYKELMAHKKSASSSSIDMIMSKIKSWTLKQLKVVVKSDTNWSLEAVKWALLKLSTSDIKITIIHSWVWNITEWDVLMCQWSSAVLIWFNVDLLGNTKNIVEDLQIEYIASKIIYHITERVEKIVSGMLDPKEVEIKLWYAEIGWIFYEGEWFMILWLKLKSDSKIERHAQVRVARKDKYLGLGKIENLKSWIIDVVDLEGPIECWIKLKTDVMIELWDSLEIFKVEVQK